MSYYQFIDGVRYVRDLLEAAEQATQGRGESRISYDEIQELYKLAEDGRGITDTERRTLLYIAGKYTLTDKAMKWLEETMGGHSENNSAWEEMIRKVIRETSNFESLEWKLDDSEIDRQLAIIPNQNFEHALTAALMVGIYNGESSLSFRDFIRQEVWIDPELGMEHYMREYINTGTLHLIPLDNGGEPTSTSDIFPFPDSFVLFQNNQWYFGLEMLAKTQVRFLINIPRENSANMLGWNDGYILPNALSFEEELQLVLTNEFELPDLTLLFPEEEFYAQSQQFGPNWVHAPGLLRLAINTILNDYLNAYSVFNIVRQVHLEEIDPQQFDAPIDYRKAVSAKVREYLNTGTIELLSAELPDNNPIDGEPIEDYWQFFVTLPALSDHGFWVIIPRWPDDEELAYVYGVN